MKNVDGGEDRKRIYDLLRSWGLEITPERHEALRYELKTYVLHRNEHYLRVIDDLNKRIYHSNQ